MAAVPSIGRAVRVERAPAPQGDLTRALYEEYASQVFRYCLHQLGSREEAEDAVQSTFLNAFRGIKGGVVPELESAWLFKIGLGQQGRANVSVAAALAAVVVALVLGLLSYPVLHRTQTVILPSSTVTRTTP